MRGPLQSTRRVLLQFSRSCFGIRKFPRFSLLVVVCLSPGRCSWLMSVVCILLVSHFRGFTTTLVASRTTSWATYVTFSVGKSCHCLRHRVSEMCTYCGNDCFTETGSTGHVHIVVVSTRLCHRAEIACGWWILLYFPFCPTYFVPRIGNPMSSSEPLITTSIFCVCFL